MLAGFAATLLLLATPEGEGAPAPTPEGEVAPAPAPAPPAPAPEAPPAAAPAPARATGTHFRGALEAVAESFPSGTPGGSQDVFVLATPLLGFDGGDDFGFELGAPLRLRIFDDPPEQKSSDYYQLIRRQDWDESSDFGQILRELRIGPEDGAVAVRGGPQLEYTLGHGHLVNRLSNRDNPDYHPCGVHAHLVFGPSRTDFIATDFLASRLFAAETSVDMGRVMSTDSAQYDRYHLAVSFAHDNGASGLGSPPMTLLHIDFDLALHKSEAARVFAYTGLGSNIFVQASEASDLGAVLGLSAEGAPGGVDLGGKLEGRKQNGKFRQGMFGPDYELARYSAVGLDGGPLADERLPDAVSAYAEFHLASGAVEGTGPRIVLSGAAEYYSWRRLDTDGSLAVRLADGKLVATGRFVINGVGQRPRYLATGELRYRFASALYALATAGSVYFPQPDKTLVRGVYGGAGLGIDFER